jgi:hypothetical protein
MLNIRQIVGAVLLFVKGLIELLGRCKDFYELEKGIHELCQKVWRNTGIPKTNAPTGCRLL